MITNPARAVLEQGIELIYQADKTQFHKELAVGQFEYDFVSDDGRQEWTISGPRFTGGIVVAHLVDLPRNVRLLMQGGMPTAGLAVNVTQWQDGDPAYDFTATNMLIGRRSRDVNPVAFVNYPYSYNAWRYQPFHTEDHPQLQQVSNGQELDILTDSFLSLKRENFVGYNG